MNTQEQPAGNNREGEESRAESVSFSRKADEYLERIENGTESIEQILEGIAVNGHIYNTIKERFYQAVPSNSRDNTNRPFAYPILEEFLSHQVLSVDNEENAKNARVRTAILHFSKADWEKQEEDQVRDAETNGQIEDIRKDLGIPSSSLESAHDGVQQETDNFLAEHIKLEKTINLPEMERVHDQEAIGDLNGSHEGFVAHLSNRELIAFEGGEMVWTGQDKSVVFIGDILGDRTPEGLRIYTDLLKLKNQAEAVGGNVVWLSGNHENMFNAILCGFTTEFGVPVENDMEKRLSQYSGNLELAEFLPDEDKIQIMQEVITKRETILQDMQETIQRKEKTLTIMQASPENFDQAEINAWVNVIKGLEEKRSFIQTMDEATTMSELLKVSDLLSKGLQNSIGRKILEQRSSIKERIASTQPEIFESIKQQQLIQMDEDVLYVHTNLTVEMAEMVFKNISKGETIADSIGKVNRFYSYCLEKYINGEESELSPIQVTSFNTMRDAFISTSSQSRVNFFEDTRLTEEQKRTLQDKLKSLGVNLVVHGHNDEEGKPKGSSELPIVSIDRSAYKSDNPKNYSPTSAGAVSKDGTFSYF